MKYIVVPVCNTADKCRDYLDNLLTSIKNGGYYSNGYHVILCYDNCSQEFQNYFKTKYEGDLIAAINNQNVKNLNFCKNVNTGYRLAHHLGGEHVILCNMDVILPHYLVMDLTLSEGLSSPTPVDDPEYKELQPAPFTKTEVLRFGGFCICIAKEVTDKIGFLDERFTASFEDDDICARAKLAGFKVEQSAARVHHELKDRKTPSNTGAYTENDLGIHMEIFRRKWSIPYTVGHDGFNQWILDNHKWVDVMRCS